MIDDELKGELIVLLDDMIETGKFVHQRLKKVVEQETDLNRSGRVGFINGVFSTVRAGLLTTKEIIQQL